MAMEMITTIIDQYLFSLSSKEHGKGPCSALTMIEEMNRIKRLYQSEEPVRDVLRECVCVRHGHQYCISERAVEEAVERLLVGECLLGNLGRHSLINKKGKILSTFIDFEELYECIKQMIGGIHGIGPLTVYDTAKRIGHIVDTPVYPRQYVYLFAGAADGAKGLFPDEMLSYREPVSRFEPYFGTLPSLFIEDILCVFASELNVSCEQLNVEKEIILEEGI